MSDQYIPCRKTIAHVGGPLTLMDSIFTFVYTQIQQRIQLDIKFMSLPPQQRKLESQKLMAPALVTCTVSYHVEFQMNFTRCLQKAFKHQWKKKNLNICLELQRKDHSFGETTRHVASAQVAALPIRDRGWETTAHALAICNQTTRC